MAVTVVTVRGLVNGRSHYEDIKACKFNGVVSGPHFSMTILIQIVEKNVAIIIFLA